MEVSKHVGCVSYAIDRLLAYFAGAGRHIDTGTAFRATAIEIGTLIPQIISIWRCCRMIGACMLL